MPESKPNIPILIPAYNPGPELLPLAHELMAHGLWPLVIVDDGSAPGCQQVFDQLSAIAGCEIVRHAINLGKGRALKTGMNHILLRYPEAIGVVTADADGQHLVADIVKVAAAMVKTPSALILGVRRFGSGTPLRSLVGNYFTRLIFALLVGKLVTDTQTGLRGIPRSMLQLLPRLEGEGYEFETNMLMAAKWQQVVVHEVPITTVYLDGNSSSHFNPFIDSMKIMFLLSRFLLSSLMAAILDVVIFMVVLSITNNVPVSIFVGRFTIGPFVNYVVNRNFVFRNKLSRTATFARYALVAISLGTLVSHMIQLLTVQFGVSALVAKVMVESILFLVSFTLQRDFVFRAGSIESTVTTSQGASRCS